MSDVVTAWLAARDPAPPVPLATALREAVAPYGREGSVALALAEAGVATLRAAVALGEERAAAFHLLTADALLTYAVEAAAEQGMDTVEAVLELLDARALARTLDADVA